MANIDQHGYIRPGPRPKHTKKKLPAGGTAETRPSSAQGTCPVGRLSKRLFLRLQKASKSRFPVNHQGDQSRSTPGAGPHSNRCPLQAGGGTAAGGRWKTAWRQHSCSSCGERCDL